MVEDSPPTNADSPIADGDSEASDADSEATDKDSEALDEHSVVMDEDSVLSDGDSEAMDADSVVSDGDSVGSDEDSVAADAYSVVTDAYSVASSADSHLHARHLSPKHNQIQEDFSKVEDNQQRRLNCAQSESAFMADNKADFPTTSPGGKAVLALNAQIAAVLLLAGEQRSEAARSNIGIKEDLFDELKIWMQKINRAAIGLADDVPGIRDLFRMPDNRSEENRLATARNFYTASAPYEAQIEEYDLPSTFRADGMGIITEIEAAQAAADTGAERTGGATGGLAAAFKEISRLHNKLNAIVKNKYAGNPQKLAAWTIASHLEAPPKRGGTTPPPTA